MSCYGVFVPLTMAAVGGRSEHTPTDKMLEFSLLRLKESAQKTMQKNERLSFENDMLRKSIQDLQRVKETLSMKKAELSGRIDAYRPPEKIRFTEIVDIDGRRKRTQELITVFQHDVKYLEEKVRILNDSLNGEGLDSYKQMLLKKKKESEKNLSESEKSLKFLKKGNQGLLQKVDQLKGEQNGLAREIEILQNKINRF